MRRGWRICLCLLLLLPVLALRPIRAEEEIDQEQLYREQLEASGAEEIFHDLPAGTPGTVGQAGNHGAGRGEPHRPAAGNRSQRAAGRSGRAVWRGAGQLRYAAGYHPAVRFDGQPEADGPGTGGFRGVRRHLRAGGLRGGAVPDGGMYPAGGGSGGKHLGFYDQFCAGVFRHPADLPDKP